VPAGSSPSRSYPRGTRSRRGAADAFVAVGYRNEEFVGAALNDFQTLVRLGLGRYPEPGAPVDPSPGGPLGRL
jgi:hypothetical protein